MIVTYSTIIIKYIAHVTKTPHKNHITLSSYPFTRYNMATYNFISEPDATLLCSICLELASQPKQCEDCGKLFCSECIEKNGGEALSKL